MCDLSQQWQHADFWQWHANDSPTNYYLAVSGGLDSMALMHLLAGSQSRLQAPLVVVYINHNWHPQAAQWGDFVAAQARSLSLPFKAITVNYDESRQSSPEAMAREARYKAFAQFIDAKSVLLTAHHQDDQAETLLLQLLRGAGLHGMAAMSARSEFAGGQHWRPLLTYPRAMIESYISQHQIAFVEDPSNVDQRYRRNWLRLAVMPVLNAQQPNATANIARSAEWLGEALSLETYFLNHYFANQALDRLPISQWITEPHFVQKAILRQWLRRLNIPALSSQQLEEWLAQIQQQSGHPIVYHQQYAIVCHDDCLYVFKHTNVESPPQVTAKTVWYGIGELHIEEGFTRLEQLQGELSWTLYPPGGEFRPLKAQHHHSVKEWLRRERIPPYIRHRTPMLRLDDKIIWVAGLGSAFGYEWLGINWQKKAHSVSISSYPLSVSDNS